MTKEIPQEEIEALFHEISKVSGEEVNLEKERDLPLLYKFYSYKFAKLLKQNSTLSFGLNVEVIPSKILKVNDLPDTANFKINLENKFFVYVKTDTDKLSQLEKLLYKGLGNKVFIENILAQILKNLLFDTGLDIKVDKNTYIFFLSEEIYKFSFTIFVKNLSFLLDLYVEKDLLDSGLIPKVLFASQTEQEKKKLEMLLSLIDG